MSLCINCWAFISYYQRKFHNEHEILTPAHFQNFEYFNKILIENEKWIRNNEVYYRPHEALPFKELIKTIPTYEKKLNLFI